MPVKTDDIDHMNLIYIDHLKLTPKSSKFLS